MEGIYTAQIKGNNLTATTDPTSLNDINDGRLVGSIWVNTSTSPRKLYQCTNNTASAAVWERIDNNDVTATSGGNYVDQDNYTLYNDGASAIPVDATGGSATIQWNVNSTNPLSGTEDRHFVKPGSNVQGQGVSFPFTIDNRHKAKVLELTADYEVISGTYATGDLEFFVYEVTGTALIRLNPSQVENVVVGNRVKFIATFQTHYTNSSYRLALHVATTSTSAYTLGFNNISIWEQEHNIGAMVTAPKTYIPTTQGLGTLGTTNVNYWYEGNILCGEGSTIAGTTTATEFRLGLPDGRTVSSRITETTREVGTLDKDVNTSIQMVLLATAGHSYLRLGISSTGGGDNPLNPTASTSSFIATGNRISFRFRVLVEGLESSMILSSQTSSRPLKMLYTNSVAASVVSGTNGFRYSTKVVDSHGIYDTTNGKITIPFYGFFKFWISIVNTAAGTNRIYLWRKPVGGVLTKTLLIGTVTDNGDIATAPYECFPGDEIYLAYNTATTQTPQALAEAFIACIHDPSGQTIARDEDLDARYNTAAGQSIAASTITIVDFGTRDFDSHGAVVTGASWKFTATRNDKFFVEATTKFSAYLKTVGQIQRMYLYKNGTIYCVLDEITHEVAVNQLADNLSGSTEIDLLAGEFIDVRLFQTNASSQTLVNNSLYNYISIKA